MMAVSIEAQDIAVKSMLTEHVTEGKNTQNTDWGCENFFKGFVLSSTMQTSLKLHNSHGNDPSNTADHRKQL